MSKLFKELSHIKYECKYYYCNLSKVSRSTCCEQENMNSEWCQPLTSYKFACWTRIEPFKENPIISLCDTCCLGHIFITLNSYDN